MARAVLLVAPERLRSLPQPHPGALHGDWPDDLDALIRPHERGHRLLDRTTLPRDAWGRAYRYDRSGDPERVPRVYTLGAEGEVGGRGDDRDVDDWSLRADPR